MKKLSLIALLFSIVILSGCGKNNPENKPDYSANSGEISVVENKDIPTCNPEKLTAFEILNVEDVVKNCTTKEKEGKFLDGLGGVCGEYLIYNNQLVNPTFGNKVPQNEIVCKSEDGAEYMLAEKGDSANYDLPGLSVAKKVVGKGFIKNISPKCFPDSMYCEDNDIDCSDMIDYGGWENGPNYFVAGKRDVLDQIYYVINDKVYSPGKSNPEGGVMKDSKRNFVGIKDNKIIVKRIKGGQIKGTPNLDDPTLDLTTVKSTFTLETCEIDL